MKEVKDEESKYFYQKFLSLSGSGLYISLISKPIINTELNANTVTTVQRYKIKMFMLLPAKNVEERF